MNVVFLCTSCDRIGSADVSSSTSWQCPRCDHVMQLEAPTLARSEEGDLVQQCAVCGNHELYRMKGFPHWLGLSLLTIACVAFLILQGSYDPYLAWGILLGSALIDVVLYVVVPDVVTCYRCGSRHRGIRKPTNEPFELTTHERYRYEKAQNEEKSES